MADDVLINKAATIERAVRRVREEYAGDDANLAANQTRQDSIILNLQRACESSIDAAMHLVRVQETREAFELLQQAQIIDAELADRLKKMVGFRNIAVHDYQRLNLDIVRQIVTPRASWTAASPGPTCWSRSSRPSSTAASARPTRS